MVPSMPQAHGRPPLLTNHAYVLLAIVSDPGATVREVAQRVGITERATYAVMRQLEDAGYLKRNRRRGKAEMTINLDAHLEHPLLRSLTLGDLLALLRMGTGRVRAAGRTDM
jgi:DNA-binding IclR family transcriptional regulator